MSNNMAANNVTFAICEFCYQGKPDCKLIWNSPDGRKGCTHQGAPIHACKRCRKARSGHYRVFVPRIQARKVK